MTVVDLGNVLSFIALAYAFSAFIQAMRKADMSEDFQTIHDMLLQLDDDVPGLEDVIKVAETNADKWHDSDRWSMHGLIAIFVMVSVFGCSRILQDHINKAHYEGFREGKDAAYEEMLMEQPARPRKESQNGNAI